MLLSPLDRLATLCTQSIGGNVSVPRSFWRRRENSMWCARSSIFFQSFENLPRVQLKASILIFTYDAETGAVDGRRRCAS